jgi:hypothetical protein
VVANTVARPSRLAFTHRFVSLPFNDIYLVSLKTFTWSSILYCIFCFSANGQLHEVEAHTDGNGILRLAAKGSRKELTLSTVFGTMPEEVRKNYMLLMFFTFNYMDSLKFLGSDGSRQARQLGRTVSASAGIGLT